MSKILRFAEVFYSCAKIEWPKTELPTDVPELIEKEWYGTHKSSNIETIAKGFEQRDYAVSIARTPEEEDLANPLPENLFGKPGRVKVRVTGKGLDFENEEHAEFISEIMHHFLGEGVSNVQLATNNYLRSLGVSWVNGWNGIGPDRELHVIDSSAIEVLGVEDIKQREYLSDPELRQLAWLKKSDPDKYKKIIEMLKSSGVDLEEHYESLEDMGLSREASLKKEAKGWMTLYHIDKHGPGYPRSILPKYTEEQEEEFGYRGFRPWKEKYPETVLWLTPNWLEVMTQHGIGGKVHAYRVDRGLVNQAGGLHRYADASEVIFTEELWQQGLRDGKIRYLGVVPESKVRAAIQEADKLRGLVPQKSPVPRLEQEAALTTKVHDLLLKLPSQLRVSFSSFVKRYKNDPDVVEEVVKELESGNLDITNWKDYIERFEQVEPTPMKYWWDL